MKYYVYLLGSIKKSKIKTYVGYTSDLKNRISKHNLGKGAKSTRGREWKILYSKKYLSKKKAMSVEYFLKKDRSRRKKILTKYLATNQL